MRGKPLSELSELSGNDSIAHLSSAAGSLRRMDGAKRIA
jgi:hypothetical protein